MAAQAIISAPWLDKVVINSGHQHLRVGPDRQPSLVPPDEKAAVRRICVATRSKTLSAGHMVVCFVTGEMVGDRRFPGATILGARSCTPSANHPVSVPPTGPEHSDASFCGQCTRWQVVHIQVGSLSGLQFTQCGVFVASCCGSSKKASTQKGLLIRCFWGARSRRSLTS